MCKRPSKASISALLLAVTGAAQAQIAYNGDFRGGDSNVTQADTLSDMVVFDQVQVLGPHVTTIWGNFLIYQQFTGSSLGLTYQIRTGVSSGNGGTLLKSGAVSNLQQTLTGRSTQNDAYREVQLLGTVDFDLAPGTYWLGLQNNEGSNPPSMDFVSCSDPRRRRRPSRGPQSPCPELHPRPQLVRNGNGTRRLRSAGSRLQHRHRLHPRAISRPISRPRRASPCRLQATAILHRLSTAPTFRMLLR